MFTIADKISLRRPEFCDLEALWQIKNNRETAAALGGFSIGYTRKGIEKWIECNGDRSGDVIFVIVDLESDQVIGHVGLYDVDYRVRKAEFAILIGDARFHGRGYGGLCTAFMIEYARKELNLQRLELSVLAGNSRAIALYEKHGFFHEGVRKRAQYKNGVYHDVVLMGFLYDEN